MRTLFSGVIGFALLATPAFAQSGTCASALADLDAQWQAMGFHAPEKPSQAQIVGAGGQVISGVDYRHMVSEMRFAANDCEAGRDMAALQRIDGVKAALAAGHPGGAVAEGTK